MNTLRIIITLSEVMMKLGDELMVLILMIVEQMRVYFMMDKEFRIIVE